MADIVVRERAELVLTLNNVRPVDVTDLGRSLHALGREYEQFVLRSGVEIPPVNARLFVSNLQTGSIIVTLQTLLDQGSFILKHLDILAGFLGNLRELLNWLYMFDKEKPPANVDAASVERISTILEPTANDHG